MFLFFWVPRYFRYEGQMTKRESGDRYLEFGFTCPGVSSAPDAQCVLLPNFIKQFHGYRSITTACTYEACWLQRQTFAFLNRRCNELKHSQTDVTSFIKGENADLCEASYKVSCHVAHCRVTHKI